MRSNGPIGRISRIPVRCDKCGGIKSNVIYKNHDEAPNLEEKIDNKQENEKKTTIKLNKPINRTHYIDAIIKHQKQLSKMHPNRDC